MARLGFLPLNTTANGRTTISGIFLIIFPYCGRRLTVGYLRLAMLELQPSAAAASWSMSRRHLDVALSSADEVKARWVDTMLSIAY